MKTRASCRWPAAASTNVTTPKPPWRREACLWWRSAVSQAANDKQQLEPMLDKIGALPEELGKPENLLADTGYFSATNVAACAKAGTEPLIAKGRQPHHLPVGRAPLRSDTGSAGRSNAGRDHGASAEDAGRPSALRDAQADPGACFRDHQIGAGISSVFAARPQWGARRMEPRHHGMEHQAAVRLRPRSDEAGALRAC